MHVCRNVSPLLMTQLLYGELRRTSVDNKDVGRSMTSMFEASSGNKPNDVQSSSQNRGSGALRANVNWAYV